MELTLYNNSSELIRVDKSNYLTTLLVVDGALKSQCSVNRPIITINTAEYNVIKVVDNDNKNLYDSDNKLVIGFQSELLEANYCYIREFNRYYFIEEVVSISNILWQIRCRVDVLMSFKDKILENHGYVERNEFEYNLDIEDSEMSYESDVDVSFTTIDNDLFDYNENETDFYVVTLIAKYD